MSEAGRLAVAAVEAWSQHVETHGPDEERAKLQRFRDAMAELRKTWEAIDPGWS